MADPEEPPTKISEIDLSSLCRDKDEEMSDTASNATAEDTPDHQDDTAEVFNSHLESFADQLIKASREKGKPSQGVPEIMFCIECSHPEHPVTNTLGKGLFSIKGSELFGFSVSQAVKWAEENLLKS